MKKLITSAEVTFKTGDNTYTRQHLVAADVANDATENEILHRTTDIVNSRFKDYYPQSELISIVPIPTMTPITTQIQVKGHAIFSEAFTSDQLPPMQIDSSDSDMVLVDETGERKFFNIWFYDHFNKNWIEASSGVEVEEETLKKMRWMHLPLAKYDK